MGNQELWLLQKPRKTKGPLSNLRPIILLSTLRRILACSMSRIKQNLDSNIPKKQAAYRQERSTADHIFARIQIIERTIYVKNESVYLFLLFQEIHDSYKLIFLLSFIFYGISYITYKKYF